MGLCGGMLSVMTAQAASTRTLSDTDFPVAIDDRYFADYAPGAVYEYGHIVVTAEEIVEFAERSDPLAGLTAMSRSGGAWDGRRGSGAGG